LALVVLFAFFLMPMGCAQKQGEHVAKLKNQLEMKDQSIKALKEEQKTTRGEATQYKKELARERMKRQALEKKARSAMDAGSMVPENELLPPNAKGGECYTRVFVPPKYKTVTEKVLKRGASERIEVTPPRYELEETSVLVKEASQRLEVIPPQYDEVEERILVRETSSRLEQVPAEYGWEEEKVLVKEAHTTGEIMCLVEMPAQYKTVKRKVMTRAPTTRTINIPAEYQTLKKRVVVKPATTRTIEIPAVYKTVKVKKMVVPPQERKISIPAEYTTITRTIHTNEGQMEWRRILCETNTTPNVILKMQRALAAAGHSPGDLDGLLGARTIAALTAYQRKHGLAIGGVTYATLEKLGIFVSP
jgi:cell division protein FtsB